ncbi:MAG: GIY-YIG nuclease family protein [Gammaproteobacteria bacterium]|nr:MAG: GIY-YIG nuclease family protein [Gammaproteobacteria bacterium]
MKSSEQKEPNWYVYIVRCSDNTLYTGIATDLERRVHEHNNSPKGSKYTRARRPVELVYSEVMHNRSQASRRENLIKQLTNREKQLLIEKGLQPNET